MVRKYLFSGAMLSALLAGIGLLLRTLRGPRTIALLLGWVSWLASTVVAVLAVREESAERSASYRDDRP